MSGQRMVLRMVLGRLSWSRKGCRGLLKCTARVTSQASLHGHALHPIESLHKTAKLPLCTSSFSRTGLRTGLVPCYFLYRNYAK